MMKKSLVLFCILSLALLAGCAGTTTFSDFQVEATDTALEAAGTVSLRGQDGVVLTIRALEPFSTTLHLTYSKGAGEVSVVLDDAQEVSLEASAAEDAVTDLPVSLAEGRNDIALSGADCQVAYAAVLDVPDFALVESFGTGSIR